MVTKIKLLTEKKFQDAVLVTGLPGIGLVGKIAVDYLMSQLKTQKIAEIYSDSFPPSVHTKNGLINLIIDEIFHYNLNGKDFLFLVGPVQPSLDFRAGTTSNHYEFAEQIVNVAKILGVTKIYTLAGINIGDRRIDKEPSVIAAATSKKLLDELSKLGAVTDKKEGLISGAAGLILGSAKIQKIEGACLMGETNSQLIYGDHGSAKKVLELLVKMHGFKIDMKNIEKEAKQIEKTFTQLSKQLEELRVEENDKDLTYVR
ncbi:MAG: PAC2 family protein [Candidatus Diapherotrites archaeon]